MTTTIPMRFVIAPSGFKESLDAESVAAAMAAGIRRVLPGAHVDTVPLVDGGEGSAKTLAAATDGEIVPATVTGPVGRPVESHFAVLGGPADAPRTAFVEMAAAAGLRLVPNDERDPGYTTTYGVGELITAALDAGCRRILVGCGDSGTSDGGAGALRALGARVLGPDGEQVADGGYALADAIDLDVSGVDPRLAETEILVACNQHNVLTGDNGVARIFGPQKGATEEQVGLLEKGLTQWAKLIEYRCDRDVRTAPGTGASGGLGAGLAGVLGARLLPRFDVLLDHVDLDSKLAGATWC
nr:glycerate kinase [Saccharomonospora sp. CUA-673]